MKKYYIMILCGLFIAIHVVLRRITSIELGFMRINFVHIPMALGGAIFGPFWNGAICAASDIISFLLVPSQGAFFPGFTLSSFLSGFIFGFFMKVPLPFIDYICEMAQSKIDARKDPSRKDPGRQASPRSDQQPGRQASPRPDRQPGRRFSQNIDTQPYGISNRQTSQNTGPLSATVSLLARTLIAAFLVNIPVEAFLNTLWIAMIYNEAYSFYFVTRFIKSLAMIPVDIIIFGAIWRSIGKYIESAVIPKVAPVKNRNIKHNEI